MNLRTSNHLHLLYCFVKILKRDYIEFCEVHKMDKYELENLINFIIDQNLISQSNINRHTILHDYKKLMLDNSMKKTHTVVVLASKYGISERSVWAILRKNSSI